MHKIYIHKFLLCLYNLNVFKNITQEDFSMKNQSQKGKVTINRLTKKINLCLIIATLFVSVAGIQVEAANERDDEKIVIKIRIESVPEESQETAETIETEEVKIEEDSMVAETYESADILNTLSETELYYLAECVQIEAGGESEDGKIAAASVLINRVYSAKFPNSYQEVVSQKQNGTYQFSSYNSSVWGKKEISEETYDAIRKALTEGSNVGDATYFANMNEIQGGWFYTAQEDGTLEKVAEIGGHTFFRTN